MDIWFVALLLLSHKQVVAKMRNLPWIITGLLVPTALSTSVHHQWVELGTVNANYLFFLSLCMWLFYALGVVEFVTAYRTYFLDD